ncbi:MAG: hypothetical protein OEZ01_00600 [Candidatus Heimdallarchaeota archaeon]|nr:hypothetical protein [Candidatus Heimdallarchaeota archaeon]MDH5676605.1 hypothetical protein [Myxococcales bacterium]
MAAKKKKKATKKKGDAPKKPSPAHRYRLEVKDLGPTADGRSRLFEGHLANSKDKLPIGVVTAPAASTARAKLHNIVKQLVTAAR